MGSNYRRQYMHNWSISTRIQLTIGSDGSINWPITQVPVLVLDMAQPQSLHASYNWPQLYYPAGKGVDAVTQVNFHWRDCCLRSSEPLLEQQKVKM